MYKKVKNMMHFLHISYIIESSSVSFLVQYKMTI